METITKNSRKSLWLSEWEIDRKLKLVDEKEELEASASQPVIVEGEYNNEELSGDIKDVSPYVDISTLEKGDIVIVSNKQCEATWPMHFAVFHSIPGEVILIPFNNLSEPASSMECKMYKDAFPFTRVLCLNAMFTADPNRLKSWHAGKMDEKDVKLMEVFMRHQMAGVELPEEAKERQGCFAGQHPPPNEFIEYQNELHVIVNRLALQVRTF